jgi:ERF superfamily
MNQSQSIAALAAALAKAQGQMRGAKKDSDNPFFKSKYADLGEVWNACRDALASNGISIIQTPDGDTPETMSLVTTLAHASGEWISGKYPIKPIKLDPQGIGSAITYARRYALAAMVGVASEDDDGESASGRQAPPKKSDSQGNAVTKKPTWTPEQTKEAGAIRADILAEFGDLGDKQLAIVRSRVSYDPPADQIDAIATLLNELRETKTQGNNQ